MAVATYDQVRYAQAFLRSVGANWRDNYLILVVVAWIIAANRGWTRIRGNNPFLVRATAADARYRVGTFKLNGVVYSRYASFDAAIPATIHVFLRGYPGNTNTLWVVLRAFRQAKGSKGAAAVAYALSNSHWDDPRKYTTAKGKNLILVVMSRFTGLQLKPPIKPPPVRPPKKPQDRNFPTPGRYPIPEVHHKWPVPTAPLSFLRERQWVPDIWTSRKV